MRMRVFQVVPLEGTRFPTSLFKNSAGNWCEKNSRLRFGLSRCVRAFHINERRRTTVVTLPGSKRRLRLEFQTSEMWNTECGNE